MPRNYKNLGARREFAELLDAHLKRGQRADIPPRAWKPWKNTAFAAALGVSPNSVANWRNVDFPIPPDDIQPALEALFGVHTEFNGHRNDLKEAWERAKGLVPLEIDNREVEDDWVPIEREVPTALAETILHQPEPHNGLEIWRLHATVRLDAAQHHDEDERTVMIGMTEAFLAIETAGYQIARGSLLGERTSHDCVRGSVGGMVITGPAPEGYLRGNPIGQDHIAVIEPGPKGKSTVSAKISVSPADLRFWYRNGQVVDQLKEATQPNKKAVLRALFGEDMKRDRQGRIVVASATIQRKIANDD